MLLEEDIYIPMMELIRKHDDFTDTQIDSLHTLFPHTQFIVRPVLPPDRADGGPLLAQRITHFGPEPVDARGRLSID